MNVKLIVFKKHYYLQRYASRNYHFPGRIICKMRPESQLQEDITIIFRHLRCEQ